MKRTGDSSYLVGVKKKRFWCPFWPVRVLSLNKSTAGACTVPFRAFSPKDMPGDNVLF